MTSAKQAFLSCTLARLDQAIATNFTYFDAIRATDKEAFDRTLNRHADAAVLASECIPEGDTDQQIRAMLIHTGILTLERQRIERDLGVLHYCDDRR